MAVPLLDAPHHGRLVRGAHHDAVERGRGVILGIVLGKRPIPDRGPNIVGLESKRDFENLCPILVIQSSLIPWRQPGAEILRRPEAGLRVLVVDEKAPILHGRLALAVRTGKHIEAGFPLRRDIVPKMPGRDADLRREVVDAVNGPALIASHDDERPGNARQRLLDRLRDKGLPLAGD